MKSFKKVAVCFAGAMMLSSTGLTSTANAAAADNIIAGGATFPLNIIESCRASFAGDSTANPLGATVQYTGVGSGTGRRNFYTNLYDGFAMSDSVYKSSDTSYRSSFVWLPLISGAIDVAYRLDGVKPAGTVLQFKAETIAKIFSGAVTNWNDPLIKADNPVSKKPRLSALNGAAKFAVAKKTAKTTTITVNLNRSIVTAKSKNLVISSSVDGSKAKVRFNKKPKPGITRITVPYVKGALYSIKYNGAALGNISVDATSVVLPSTPITVYHRKETSGTTSNFLNYLNKAAPSVWTTAATEAFLVPSGSNPTDGSFVGAQGNDGVANGVMNKNGGIGYAEVSFVTERQNAGKSIIPAKIQNGAGVYLAGSSVGASKFVEAATVDSSTGIVTFNYATTVADAYPITAVSYFMANTSANTNSANTAAKMLTAKRFATYVLDTCAPEVAELKGYAALPSNMVTIAKQLIQNIQ